VVLPGLEVPWVLVDLQHLEQLLAATLLVHGEVKASR
jgi:hypothetical protein